MGVYNKEMKMPRTCDECLLFKTCEHISMKMETDEESWTLIWAIPDSCPLVEVDPSDIRIKPKAKHKTDCAWR